MARETVLLLDGDVLAFRAAAAVEKRSVIVTHIPTGKEKVFKNRTEFRTRLKEKGTPEDEVNFTYKDVQEAEDISHCLRNIKSRVALLKEQTEADRVEIYIGGAANFRDTLALPTKYKAGRTDDIRPLHLADAKKYLVEVHGAVKAWEIEADDVLSVRGYEEHAKRNKAIIGSIDKDTLQSNGLYFYDWTQEKPTIVEIPEGPGFLVDTGKKITGAGLKFFCYQLLFGDPVDKYKPTQLAGIKYGEKSAFKDLNDLQTEAEIIQKVIHKYKTWYPEPFDYTAWDGTEVQGANWESMLDLYFKCAYMKRSWDDPSDWKLFFKEYGYDDSL